LNWNIYNNREEKEEEEKVSVYNRKELFSGGEDGMLSLSLHLGLKEGKKNINSLLLVKHIQ